MLLTTETQTVLVQTLMVVELVCLGSGTSLGSLSRLLIEKEILTLCVVIPVDSLSRLILDPVFTLSAVSAEDKRLALIDEVQDSAFSPRSV